MAGTSGRRKLSGNDKIRIAYIGIGNQGAWDIAQFESTGLVDVVALCDVDIEAKHTQKVLNMYPNARRFRNFREMFEKYASNFEAVCAAVPDHMHFPVAMMAMKYGKHIYLEKPMCRTFHEAELMMEYARMHPEIVTQVGNQGHSEANYFQWKAWQEAGIIKDVTAITAHMNNPRRWHGFDVNMKSMPAGEPLPNPDIDWDTWVGACGWRDYSHLLHQGNWRCWYEFGMGALGDWGAHILDTAVGHNDYFFPMSSTILFRFGARDGMPPCDVTWYDGVDNVPMVPSNYGESEYNPDIPATNQGNTPVAKLNPGKEIYMSNLVLKGGSHGSTLSMLPSAAAEEWKTRLPEVPETTSNHHLNFLRACRGEEKSRSHFDFNGVLSQVFWLGVFAQRISARLFFDPHTKRFTNNEFANALLTGMPPRKGWEEFYKI